MSQHLTLELSDEVYADLQQKASAVGLSIVEWAIVVLNTQPNGASRVLHSIAQLEAARQRFRNHAGSVSLGYPTDLSNESIDADLARAYAGEFEE